MSSHLPPPDAKYKVVPTPLSSFGRVAGREPNKAFSWPHSFSSSLNSPDQSDNPKHRSCKSVCPVRIWASIAGSPQGRVRLINYLAFLDSDSPEFILFSISPKRRSNSCVSIILRRISSRLASCTASPIVISPFAADARMAASAWEIPSAVLMSVGSFSRTGRSLRGAISRSKHRRRAVSFPALARQIAFRVIASPSPSSSACKASVAVFRLPAGRPLPNRLPGRNGLPGPRGLLVVLLTGGATRKSVNSQCPVSP